MLIIKHQRCRNPAALDGISFSFPASLMLSPFLVISNRQGLKLDVRSFVIKLDSKFIYYWKFCPSLFSVPKTSLNQLNIFKLLQMVLMVPHLDVSSLTRSALQPLLVPLTYKALVGSLFMETCIWEKIFASCSNACCCSAALISMGWVG